MMILKNLAKLFSFYLLFVSLLSTNYSFAQSDAETALPDIEIIEPSFEEKIIALKAGIKEKQQEKTNLEKALKQENDAQTVTRLQQQLATTQDVIQGLSDEIVLLATNGVNIYADAPVEQESFDWQSDLQDILEPIMGQLRDVTERPRKMERLKAEIDYWRVRVDQLVRAEANIASNVDALTQRSLKREITQLLDSAASNKKTAEQKLLLLENELEALQKTEGSVWTLIQDIFVNIVAGMLLHIILAVFAAIVIYQFVILLSLIPINILKRRQTKDPVFAERAVVVARTVIGALLAMMTYFITLYSFTEWLVILVSLLIIAGLVLGLKEVLPTYFLEVKTVLNMGTVRHGERLIYQGLPWRINRLNMHTYLHNSALHGHLRVPLAEIMNLSSRPYHDDEPWFPTKTGDFILLDNIYGKVVRQTPEMVEVNMGNAIFTYPTQTFLAQCPRNLSREGFSVYETFGIDYQHQQDVTDKILNTYEQGLKAAIQASPFAAFNNRLMIEFSFAGASSLDFRIIARFTGDAAGDYFKIKRLIHKASVELANQHGWVIPFQQITLHQADASNN